MALELDPNHEGTKALFLKSMSKQSRDYLSSNVGGGLVPVSDEKAQLLSGGIATAIL